MDCQSFTYLETASMIMKFILKLLRYQENKFFSKKFVFLCKFWMHQWLRTSIWQHCFLNCWKLQRWLHAIACCNTLLSPNSACWVKSARRDTTKQHGYKISTKLNFVFISTSLYFKLLIPRQLSLRRQLQAEWCLRDEIFCFSLVIDKHVCTP